MKPPLEARGGGTACRDGGDLFEDVLFIPSVAYGDSSPYNYPKNINVFGDPITRGAFNKRCRHYHQFTLIATPLDADRRGRRSLQFLPFHDYHHFTSITTLLETDRRGRRSLQFVSFLNE